LRFSWALIFLCILSFSPASGQKLAGRDSTSLRRDTIRNRPLIAKDTTGTRGASLSRDTTRASGVDTLVTYSSTDSIVYDFSTKKMSLFQKGQIRYRDLQLTSDRIDINWNTSTMQARGVRDTADPTGKKYRGTPEMKEGNEVYYGHELTYDFVTKKGKIDVANTTIDQGFYHGEAIKKEGKDVLYVGDGRFTTCDLPEPHYFFASPKMKVVPQDKIVAEPVYLYIADVPVFALPFGVFPNQRGRRSGLIAPAYGEDANRGRFLTHLGYYWAMSDYMDINFKSDLYSRGGWAGYSNYRYALRYNFSGSLSAEYKRLHTGESTDPGRTEDESYRMGIVHSQEFDPTTHLNVNFSFASNNSYRNTIDLNEALNQYVTSNATLSKSWEGTPNSITLNLSRQQNLLDGSLDQTLPSFNFNHSLSYPFRWGKEKSDETSRPWYQDIGFSYNAQASNRIARVHRTIGGISMLTTGGADTVGSVDAFEYDQTRNLNQGASLSIAPKLGYVTLSPSLSYNDNRSFTDNDVPDSSRGTLITVNQRDSRRVGTLSTALAASTKFYGIVQSGLLGVAALRHTVTPSLTLTYSKQVVGEDLVGKQMVMNMNIGNILEMKTMSKEEGKEGDKIQLLNLGAGISYNFSADSLNFSPIGLSYRTGIGKTLDIGGNAAFDLYKLEENSRGDLVRVNKFLINEEGRFARLTDFSIALSTSLSGERRSSGPKPPPADSTARPRSATGYANLYEEEEPDFSIPWQLSLSLNYAENKVSHTRSSNLHGHLEFNLTESWKISVNTAYDVLNRDILAPEIQISRDLHCWLMNFEWVPTGTYRHYQFEIRVKAPQLQDIKLTKSGSDRGIY
jgi:lipopolysaccharide transport LptD-like protein